MSFDDVIVRLYEAAIDNNISQFFAIGLVSLLALSVLSHFAQRRYVAAGNFARSAPTALTSIGVLGTFFGIFWGLLDFNVQDIDGSVPALLEGLKIAFVTSILGMTFSITFKIFQNIIPVHTGHAGVSADEIYTVLAEIREDARKYYDHNNSSLDKIGISIAGEGDSSVVTQIQKLRTSVADGNESLLHEFRAFAETMADNNSKALIEALEEVMRDFNAKINEQFGDNFKQLNEAVKALLTWQENYKEHVEHVGAQIDRALEAIDKTQTSLSEISDQAQSIPKAMESLSEVLENMAQFGAKQAADLEDLERHLEAFQHLRTQAGEAFPVIERNIISLTEGVSESINQSLTQMRQGFEHAVTESNEILGKQIAELDRQIQAEVQRVVEMMGSHLASLSNKFVEDYTPLTDRLREVVSMAERTKHVT